MLLERDDLLHSLGALRPGVVAAICGEAGVGKTSRERLFPQLLAALSSTPTLLVLEDVHWADRPTLDAIKYLARRITQVPLLGGKRRGLYELTGGNPFYVTEKTVDHHVSSILGKLGAKTRGEAARLYREQK
jgi:ATP/maltotriose-dependent transcriptional regulator MalT